MIKRTILITFYCAHAGPPDRNQGTARDGDEVLPQSAVSHQRDKGSLQQEIHQSHGPGPQFSQVRHYWDKACKTTVLSKQKQHPIHPHPIPSNTDAQSASYTPLRYLLATLFEFPRTVIASHNGSVTLVQTSQFV